MRRVALALAVLPSLATPLLAQGITAGQRVRIDSVFVEFDHTNRPGCSLGIARRGATAYLRGYGMSDLQHGVPITPTSVFHVASVSKQFAAFAVALLAQDGKLSLDDEVQRYVPELPRYARPITLRHLIHHVSGIRDQWELLGMAGWRYPSDLFTQQDVLDILSRQRELNFNTGDEWLYSNSGYTLLAMVVQRVSGKSLRAFSDERIFAPLGMTRTHVHDDHAMVVPGRTSAYEPRPDGWAISIPNFDTHGATSLFTTPEDLLKWQHNFAAVTVGTPSLLREALTPAVLTSGKATTYGFGISLDTYRGTPAYGHGGADAGYRADIVRFPDHDLDIAVTCNFATATPNTYARAVADILLEGALAPRPAAQATGTVSAARLDQVAGTYKSATSDQVFLLAHTGDKLVLANFGLPLDPVDDRNFRVFGTPVEFLGPPGQPPVAMRVPAAGDSLVRVPAWTPRAADLAALAGEYYSEELRVAYRVTVKDSVVTLHPFKRAAEPLRPAFPDAFIGGESGTVRFTRGQGRVTGFRLTGGRVRGVAFARVSAAGSRP